MSGQGVGDALQESPPAKVNIIQPMSKQDPPKQIFQQQIIQPPPPNLTIAKAVENKASDRTSSHEPEKTVHKKLEKILGMKIVGDKSYFLVKYSGDNCNVVVDGSIIRKHNQKVLLNFYEERIKLVDISPEAEAEALRTFPTKYQHHQGATKSTQPTVRSNSYQTQVPSTVQYQQPP